MNPPASPFRILFPADGSGCSERAAHRLVDFAHRLKVPPEVHLLYVAAPIGTPLARARLSRETLDDYYRDVATAALLSVEGILNGAGVGFTVHQAVGDAGDQITASAEKLGADLLVMGTHGRSALTSVVMGSVTSRVLAHCTVPALLVH